MDGDVGQILLAKVGLAKVGLAEVGQIRMAKVGLAKVGLSRLVCPVWPPNRSIWPPWFGTGLRVRQLVFAERQEGG